MRICDWSSDVCSSDLVDRHQRLQRGGAVGAVEAKLAHVGNVEERRRLARVLMLGHDAGRILHRQGIAGEGHHLAAQLTVQVKEDSRQIGSASCRERMCKYV